MKNKQLQFDWLASNRQANAESPHEVPSDGSFVPPPPWPELGSLAVPSKPETSANVAVSQLAMRIAAWFGAEHRRPLDNTALNELSHEILGHSVGHGRDAHDAAEAGFNMYLDRVGLDLADTRSALAKLLAEQARLPTQTRRDQKQIDFQQFSTPPAEALLVVTAAAIRTGMKVLEPSAGTGNIAVLARLAGAEVDTNEIDERRIRLLLLQGFAPTAFDAERLDNLLWPGRLYDGVVMNPPFSSTGGRVKGHSTHFGARHVEQALLRVKPGGRLVAVVGRGMALERPSFRAWWASIEQRYRVRANVGIDGSVYAKFGTSFDNQIIVIDHDGPTTSDEEIITGKGLSLSTAYELLSELSQEDVYGRIRKHDQTARHIGLADAFPAVVEGGGPTPGVDSVSFGRRRRWRPGAAGRHGDNGAVADLESPSPESATAPDSDNDERTRSGAYRASVGQGGDGGLVGPIAGGDPRPTGDGIEQLERAHLTPHGLSIEAGTVFAAYRVQKALVREAHPHPANVVESTAMASVEPPDVIYRHQLPFEVISEGRISDLQLEDVIYAGQATSMLLPDGSTRKGHWNGDGTGIGKGREIYAFIYNEFQQGRRKAIHISASHQLCADAERDRDAVGVPLPIVHQAQFKPIQAIAAEAGILFTTYTMLSKDFDGQQQRFKQLTDWLGSGFDGVIAFDEAHLMKNAAATPHGGKATVDEGTLRGNMGIALQRLFPQARVRYFSATGATEARHMAPYERLGLWGTGAPFADFSEFLVAMERGGVAAMEMLCRDLKSVGTYLSRTISYGPTRRPN